MDGGTASPGGPDGDPAEAAFLEAVGQRLRTLRARRGVTRRELSRVSGVSERHIAQLETGLGNISILLLRRVARALGLRAEELLATTPERSLERVRLDELVAALPEGRLTEARRILLNGFGATPLPPRAGRIALIGLRGAGKSTLGRLLAERRGLRFVELDREVERDSGMDLADLFATRGQEAFRALERAVLERLVAEEGLVIAAGGGIVAEGRTFGLLLDACFTVWLRARPEDHMRRVIAQGDTRPMRESRQAMADLRAILASREALYGRADITIDTSGREVEATLAELLSRIPG